MKSGRGDSERDVLCDLINIMPVYFTKEDMREF